MNDLCIYNTNEHDLNDMIINDIQVIYTQYIDKYEEYMDMNNMCIHIYIYIYTYI